MALGWRKKITKPNDDDDDDDVNPHENYFTQHKNKNSFLFNMRYKSTATQLIVPILTIIII